MPHIAYVNGRYVHHMEASVHIEDRGYQFADGIYEYIAFYNRSMLDGAPHLKRLERSLKALSIPMPMSIQAMNVVISELIERNGREHGGIYVQVTRGVARRDHLFPKNTAPALVMTVCAPKFPKPVEIKHGVCVITTPDIRWGRCDIKSVALLANVLAKQEASSHKAREAWLMDGNDVTEGAVSNAYIFTKKDVLVTHPLTEGILGGITRDVVITLAKKAGIAVEERAFTLVEARSAAEAFLTSTSANVLPVVKIDDHVVGEGTPGKHTRKLLELYIDHIYKQTGFKF